MYKYYNPANGTGSVSFENRHMVDGFVGFRWTTSCGFVGFVAGFVRFRTVLAANKAARMPRIIRQKLRPHKNISPRGRTRAIWCV